MHHVLPVLRNYFFNDGFHSVLSWFLGIKGVPFSLLLTKWGLCLNFNMQPMEMMLHTDKYLNTKE